MPAAIHELLFLAFSLNVGNQDELPCTLVQGLERANENPGFSPNRIRAKAPGSFYPELCPQAKACGNS